MKRAKWALGLLMTALAAASCTAVLGIDKDYRELEGGTGSGGAGSPSTSASGDGGAASGSASSGAGGSRAVDGATCNAILKMNNQAPNGVYTLDPDGPGG